MGEEPFAGDITALEQLRTTLEAALQVVFELADDQ
jgi:hypothetical protein